MNFINPALAARAFLFFAYPARDLGRQGLDGRAAGAAVDGFSGATLLAQMRVDDAAVRGGRASRWWNAFIGLEPGSMGETSALACLIGAVIIAVTGVGSWRTMAGVALGTIAHGAACSTPSARPPTRGSRVPFWWHMVLGGWAFGTAFMATDPVTSPFSRHRASGSTAS